MIDYDVFSELAMKWLEAPKSSKKGMHFQARCQICGDSKKNPNKKRFHLDYNNGNPGYNCFNCGAHGNFIELYCMMESATEEEAIAYLYKFNPKAIKSKLSKPSKFPKKTKKYKPDLSYILKECIDEMPTSSLVQKRYKKILKDFREERKIPFDMPLYYAYKGRYKGRIIIPIFEDNKMIYFQARAISDEIEPKYLNIPLNNKTIGKEDIIYDIENFDRDKPIVVVEGLLDAVTIGQQATTILGASITDEFLEKILEKTDKYVIVFFDDDKRGHEELNKFLDSPYSNKVKYLILPNKYKEKDINKLYVSSNDINNREDLWKFILSNVHNKLTLISKLKLGRIIK